MKNLTKILAIVTITLLGSFGSVSNAQGTYLVSPGVIYNISPHNTNWQQGYNVVYVGSRVPQLDAQTYLARLTHHVNQVRQAYGKLGLMGYIFFSDGNREIAYMNWISQDAMKNAGNTPVGQAIHADMGGFMKTESFGEVAPGDLFKLFPR